MQEKTVIGLTEEIRMFGKEKERKVRARIDTGAINSAIDTKLCSELDLGPVLHNKKIKSAHGSTIRPVIEGEVEIKGKKIKSHFTIVDRSKLKYPVLIGQNILKKDDFVIDPKID